MSETICVKVTPELLRLASGATLSAELVQEINDFCWLWPAYERGQTTSDYNVEPITGVEESALDFFSYRYLNGPDASDRLNELVRSCSEADTVRQLSSDQPELRQKALRFVVRRIRNNLFHGNKASAGIEPNELNLFKYANLLLKHWIGIPVPSE